MNGDNGYSRTHRLPPLSISHEKDDYLYDSARPSSTATNIIALYAGTDSSDEATPTNAHYSERRPHVPRPLPQPPPNPQQAPFAQVNPTYRSHSPLPPTPFAQQSYSTQDQLRSRNTPSPANDKMSTQRRLASGPLEAESAYFDRRAAKPLQYTPSNASSSTSASSYSRKQKMEPKTPPPWSPGSSTIYSSPSEPSTSQKPPYNRQYSDYSNNSTAGYSQNDGRRFQKSSPSYSNMGVGGSPSHEPPYAQPVIDSASDGRRPTHSPYQSSLPTNVPSFLSTEPISYRTRSKSPFEQQQYLPPAPPPRPRDSSNNVSSVRSRSVSTSPRSVPIKKTGRPPNLPILPMRDEASVYNQGLLSPVLLSPTPQGKQSTKSLLYDRDGMDYSLLSNIAILLRDLVPRELHVKGSVNYPFCFTGKDVVTTIQSMLPKEKMAWAAGLIGAEVGEAEGRRIALMVARALKGQLFFHEVDWSTGDLQDNVDEVYMFLEDSLVGPDRRNGPSRQNSLGAEAVGEDLPTGVFTPLTSCYSPMCGVGSPLGASCYSSSCPFAKSSLRIPLSPLTSPSNNVDSSKAAGASASSGVNNNAVAWADTVPKDFLASVPKAEIKRQNAILELIQKEEEFLHDLELLENLFLARMEKPDPATGDPPPIQLGPDRESFIVEVFSNHKELVGLISGLVEKLHVRQREDHPFVRSVGDLFLDASLQWEGAFERNMTNFPLAKNRIIREAKINPRFQLFLETCRRDPACHRLPMDHFLQRATTRLPRYNLHFKSILQDTDEANSDRESLERAIEIIDKQCKAIQKGVAAAEVKVKIREYAYNLESKRNRTALHMDLLNPERQLLHEGNVLRKPDYTGMEWQELLAVLFDNYLVVTKEKRREEGDNTSSRFVLAKRPIAVEMMQMTGFNDPSVSRSAGLSNFHLRSNVERDFRDLYPFTIAHIGGKMEPLTLYASSKAARDQWRAKLEEAKALRAHVQEANKVFESHIITSDTFALPTISSLDPEKPPPGADPANFHGAVACAVPFQAMDGRRLIAIGCSDGVWIGLRNDSRSLRKVLHLKLVTQCAVLQSFGLFVVLADKVLISYSLEALVPTSSTGHDPKPPQKLSGNRDVLFFSVGQLRDRTLLIYMKRKANESVFRALEPVVTTVRSQTTKSGGSGLFSKFSKDSKPSDSFRIYKTFFIPSEAYSMQFLRSKLCIVCARGFEIINLDSLLPGTIPDFSQVSREDIRIQQLVKRVETARPLGMFKNSESEFLLCYDNFACYVDRLGEPIKLNNIIEWEGLPRSVAFRSPFILAFDPRFIEVRDSSTGQLVQLISTNELRNIAGSSTTISSMDDEDEDAILLVQRIRSEARKVDGQRQPVYDNQQVFQLVSTAEYRQLHQQPSTPSSSKFNKSSLDRMTTTSTTRTNASSQSQSQSSRAWI
jgi:hypothetical protein